MKRYLIGLNFMEFIEAESEDEAKEKFSEMNEIKEKYLFVDREEEVED